MSCNFLNPNNTTQFDFILFSYIFIAISGQEDVKKKVKTNMEEDKSHWSLCFCQGLKTWKIQ